MKEIWKDIKDYIGLYQVSNIGRVRSRYKRGAGIDNKWNLLKPHARRDERPYVVLCKDGVQTDKAVARLVAEAFVGEILKGLEVNHIDGNPLNNTPSNLEIVTHLENMRHAVRTGLRSPETKGLPVWQLDSNGKPLRWFRTQRRAALATGATYQGIWKCVTNYRNTQTAGGFRWRYST